MQEDILKQAENIVIEANQEHNETILRLIENIRTVVDRSGDRVDPSLRDELLLKAGILERSIVQEQQLLDESKHDAP